MVAIALSPKISSIIKHIRKVATIAESVINWTQQITRTINSAKVSLYLHIRKQV
jgi:DNA-binding transcriptional regulator GbsR (MarR family)